jgi:hypothetical protein
VVLAQGLAFDCTFDLIQSGPWSLQEQATYRSATMDFDFQIGSLDLGDREDPGVLDSEVLWVSDSPIVVGRLSTTSGTSTALFSSPRSSASLGTGGVKSDCFIPSLLKIIVVG